MTIASAPRRTRPLVLCLAGHDPSGGAGIVADLQAVAAQGAHALSVITALTVQDSRNVAEVVAIDAGLLRRQVELLLADTRDQPIAAIKLGLIGAADQVPLIGETIRRLQVPVVLDPVLRAGGGGDLAGAAVQRALLEQLLPLALATTPNAAEARCLASRGEAGSLDDCAAALLAAGSRGLLVKGGDEPTPDGVHNAWHAPGAAPRRWHWPRLPGTFHGAGCTLASTLAARLALGDDLATALDRAQAWVHGALAGGYHVGAGRRIPNRIAGLAP